MTFYRYIAEMLFWLFTGLIFCGGLIAIRTRQLMNAVLGLALSLLGVAGLFYHLGSQFLALMEILLYVGAVCIIIAFGIMVGPKPKRAAEKRVIGRRNTTLAVSACLAGLTLLSVTIVQTTWVPAAVKQGDFSVKYLGENLLYQFCLAFELISVMLLAAIIGALIIANIGREDTDP
jgi:NADH-quinone oxidoreductase subunit J